MEEVVIIGMKRSPFTMAGKGNLVATRLDQLAVEVIHALLAANPKVDLAMLEEVGLGQVGQAGELLNMGSAQIAQLAGIPYECTKFESNRQCGSSMEVLQRMSQAIMLGDYDVGLCLGVERMDKSLIWPMQNTTRITQINPQLFKHHNLLQAQQAIDHKKYFSKDIPDAILQSSPLCTMLQTGQNVADMYALTRKQLDHFSLQSHRKYQHALADGFFQDEIVPVQTHAPVWTEDGQCDFTATGEKITIIHDEGFRADTSADKLALLNTVRGVQSYLQRDITITPGNSCPTSDGVSACLIMSARKAKALGIQPLAYIRGMQVSGIKPQVMGIGPVVAVKKLLQKHQLRIDDIDLIEFNEAFASQALATCQELGVDDAAFNTNGGSLAIGHPLGATGTRLVGTLARSLQWHHKRFGIATQCIGAGMGIATLLERIN